MTLSEAANELNRRAISKFVVGYVTERDLNSTTKDVEAAVARGTRYLKFTTEKPARH